MGAVSSDTRLKSHPESERLPPSLSNLNLIPLLPGVPNQSGHIDLRNQSPDTPVVKLAIVGIPGCGKTALARFLAAAGISEKLFGWMKTDAGFYTREITQSGEPTTLQIWEISTALVLIRSGPNTWY